MTSEYRLQLLIIYGIIALVTFFLSIFTQRIGKLPEWIDDAFIFTGAIFFIFLFGLRDKMVGTDTIKYVNYFENIVKFDSYFGLGSFYFNFGAGFFFLAKLVHVFTHSYHLYLFVIAFIFIASFVFAVYRLVLYNRFIVFFTFISCFFFFRFGVNIITAAVSLMFFLIAISYDQKNPKMKWFYFFLSVLFHYTSIIVVLFWFIAKKVRHISLALGIWVCFTFMSVVGFGLQPILTSFDIPVVSAFIDFGGYDHYLSDPTGMQQTGISLNAILFNLVFLIYGFYMVKIKKGHDEFYKNIYISFIYLNSLYMLAYNMTYSQRFGYMSWIFIPLIVGIPIIKYKIITGKVVLWYMFSIALGMFSFFYIL